MQLATNNFRIGGTKTINLTKIRRSGDSVIVPLECRTAEGEAYEALVYLEMEASDAELMILARALLGCVRLENIKMREG